MLVSVLSGVTRIAHGVGNAPGQDSPQGAAVVPGCSSLAGHRGRVRAFNEPSLYSTQIYSMR